MKILCTSDLNGNRDKFLDLKGTVKRFNPDLVVINGGILSNRIKCNVTDYYRIHENYDIMNDISKLSKILICFGGIDFANDVILFDTYNRNNAIINITNSIYITGDISLVFDNSIRTNPINSDWMKADIPEIECDIKDKISQISNIQNSIWFTYSNPSSLYDIQNTNEKFPFELYYDKRFCHDSYSIRKLVEGDYSSGLQPHALVSAYVDSNHEKYHTSIMKNRSCLCCRSGQYNTNFLNYFLFYTTESKIISWYHPMERFTEI